jgi:putative flippase GtrA
MKNITVLLSKPGMRYLIVGGSVYLLELAIILVAQRQGATAVWAVALAFIIGTAVSFVLQKLVTFGDKRLHHRVVGLQLLAVTVLVLFNLGFSLLATALLKGVLPAVVIRTLALGTTTIWNFYIYKTRIFKGATDLVT